MQRVANDAIELDEGEADGVGAVGRARACVGIVTFLEETLTTAAY